MSANERQELDMDRVVQGWRLTKSTPIVDMYVSVYVSSAKRRRRHDLPTPESPMRRSLKRKSLRYRGCRVDDQQ